MRRGHNVFAVIGLWLESLQHVGFAMVVVWLWFAHPERNYPEREWSLMLLFALFLSHVSVRMFDALWFHATPSTPSEHAMHRGWEALYLHWAVAPTSVAAWVAFSTIVLCRDWAVGLSMYVLTLAVGWLQLASGMLWPSDVLFASWIGLGCALVVYGLAPSMRRFFDGIQQLAFHVPHVIYPCALLLVIDMGNHLQFLTFVMRFMFGEA